MRNPKFNTKEEYLQYRKDWKAEYKQLSQIIREKRWLQKEVSRVTNKAMVQLGFHNLPYWDTCDGLKSRNTLINLFLSENEKYQTLRKKYENDYKCVELYSMQATQMLEELKESKQEAQRQYLASKEQLVTA